MYINLSRRSRWLRRERGFSRPKGALLAPHREGARRRRGAATTTSTRCALPQSYMKRELDENFSGNEVCYTA